MVGQVSLSEVKTVRQISPGILLDGTDLGTPRLPLAVPPLSEAHEAGRWAQRILGLPVLDAIACGSDSRYHLQLHLSYSSLSLPTDLLTLILPVRT